MYYVALTHQTLTPEQHAAAERVLKPEGAYLDGFDRRAGHSQPQWAIATPMAVSEARAAELVALVEAATGLDWS